ncbi:MAG: 16S rRNA (cytidine(1402)-2'-O)-methyltransferase, partial [Clostridium celatum]|nr:16S rRNA (cytidine(1402)-2'-O)-methyltransferase [Clostridium celatum]
AGKSESEFKAEKEQELSGITIEQHLINLINEGMDKKEAIKIVAKEREIPKKEVYKISINI